MDGFDDKGRAIDRETEIRAIRTVLNDDKVLLTTDWDITLAAAGQDPTDLENLEPILAFRIIGVNNQTHLPDLATFVFHLEDARNWVEAIQQHLELADAAGPVASWDNFSAEDETLSS